MSDFQSFRDAVLEDEDLQEQVISIVNTATANGAGLEENIVYQKLTAVLIEAVKEQQQEINNLSNRIAMLEGIPKAANY